MRGIIEDSSKTMKEIKINYKDISELKEFVEQGTRLVQVEYNETSGRYLYERYYIKSPSLGNRLMGYEVVKPIKTKNPDGSIVYIYPPTSKFGSYGWFLPPNTKREILDKYLKSELPRKQGEI